MLRAAPLRTGHARVTGSVNGQGAAQVANASARSLKARLPLKSSKIRATGQTSAGAGARRALETGRVTGKHALIRRSATVSVPCLAVLQNPDTRLRRSNHGVSAVVRISGGNGGKRGRLARLVRG